MAVSNKAVFSNKVLDESGKFTAFWQRWLSQLGFTINVNEVTTPAAVEDDNLVTFDGTGGATIQDSGYTVAEILEEAGDVDGPASAVTARIAAFDGTTGKLIADSGYTAATLLSTALAAAVADIIPVALASEVSGDLPLSSFVQASAASRVLGRGSAAGAGDYQEITPTTGLEISSTDLRMTANQRTRDITFIFDDKTGAALATGIKGDLEILFDCTISQVTLLADQSGDIVIDIWKDTYANYPPTVADTITAAAKPTISTAVKAQDTTLTGWTTTITAGDTLRFNVDSVTDITRVTLVMKVTLT